MVKFEWNKDTNTGGWRAQVGEVQLFAVPLQLKRGFVPTPKPGTAWRSGCSVWNDRTKTLSRFGRDTYTEHVTSAKEAMRQAEQTYLDATT